MTISFRDKETKKIGNNIIPGNCPETSKELDQGN